MPNLEATLAVQFDKATLGLTVPMMRDQILANIGPMFQTLRPSLHSIPGVHPIQPPTYDVICSEHENHAIPLLQYQAAVICCETDGMRIILHGKKEATVWAAYRSLMRITMKEVAKRMSMGHVRTGSSDSTASRDSGVSMPSAASRDSFEKIEVLKQAKSMRVLGLSGFE